MLDIEIWKIYNRESAVFACPVSWRQVYHHSQTYLTKKAARWCKIGGHAMLGSKLRQAACDSASFFQHRTLVFHFYSFFLTPPSLNQIFGYLRMADICWHISSRYSMLFHVFSKLLQVSALRKIIKGCLLPSANALALLLASVELWGDLPCDPCLNWEGDQWSIND